MLKNIIVLPDGTEVSSGSNHINAIQSMTLTQSVNNGDELTIGSACAAMMEAKLLTPGGGLDIAAGTEVALYKQDDAGERHKVGLFTLEKPTRPTAGTMKLVGYDRVTWLDKDLTAWLAGLDGWPYSLLTFAQMVCQACGLTLVTENIPNEDIPVHPFSRTAVTGRQLMSWIGEACCRFVRANADGNIELGWYSASGISYEPTGENYYFAGSLSYETYQVAAVDTVQLRLSESDSGALWPEAAEGDNAYVITDNPILTTAITEDTPAYLEAIQDVLAGATYIPCTVSVPATLAVNAGNSIRITDKNGAQIYMYVMEKVTAGQKTTLKCTGSPRRDSAAAVNNKTAAQQSAENLISAQAAARKAVENQTQEDIFLKLTDNGKLQGLFMGEDGELYINASYLKAGTLDTALLKTGKITNGSSYFDLNTGEFCSVGSDSTVRMSNGNVRIYNTSDGLIAEILTENSCGKLRLYDQNGVAQLGIVALPTGLMLSCWDLDSNAGVTHRVGFKTVNGEKVLAVGTLGT